MSTSDNLQPGQTYEFGFSRADGSEARLSGELITATRDHLEIQTATAPVFLPRRSLRVISPAATTGGSPSQKSLAANLALALDATAPSPAARVAHLRSAVASIESDITSEKTAARAVAVRQLADSVLLALAADGPLSEELERQIARGRRNAVPRAGFRATPGSLLAVIIRAAEEVSSALPNLRDDVPSNGHPESSVSSPPRIITRDTITVTRGRDNEFDLQVRITLDQDAPPLSNVTLVLDRFRNLKNIGAAPHLRRMPAGEVHVLRQRMRDNRKQGSRSDIRIDAHLAYTDHRGRTRQSARQSLEVRIYGKEEHQSIPNPFRAYAGGLPVENSKMFFGREGLVEDFVRELKKTPGGRCFSLYGQQRTGKSSVLEQVRMQLISDRAIVASLSMGILDRRTMTVDFIDEILDQWRVQIDALLPKELAGRLLARWPDQATIGKSPLKSVRRAREAAIPILRSAGLTGVPFVAIVDEFTYLHEILRRRGVQPSEHNELRDFMRQLKSLLEGRVFSALLVGQDSMPNFLDAFPNEFSVMSTRRLGYLTLDETQDLADKPVRKPRGQSRYSGYALSTIAAYTDGHPFFTQILCDRTITLVNIRKRSEVSESDVEEAVESLIAGQEKIEPHKFDCLVSADNTHALLSGMRGEEEEDRSDAVLEVLTRIAVLSGSQNHPVSVESLGLNLVQNAALHDLRVREVLRETDSGVAIRVLLYADYLRRQRA